MPRNHSTADEDTATARFADPSFIVPDHGDPIFDHLAGAGTRQVAERAVEEPTAALDISHHSGCPLVDDSLELCYRLPRLWALVHAGRLKAWKNRQVAQLTTGLGAEGGPAGQTNPANLSRLCRRHHRLKTFTSRRYERAGPGTYEWTNPHGLTDT